MSHILWKYLFEDDVDGFRQYLARATYTHGASKNAATISSSPSLKIGSPGSLGTSPKTPKQKKPCQNASAAKGTGLSLSRTDINKRDALGRTLLHHAASLKSGNAFGFVQALLDVPIVDLYVQDAENGWTALHRALYFGNIDVAHALMRRDVQNVTDFASSASLAHLGGLVKIKDFEGNSPFEVFGSTIAPRSLKNSASANLIDNPDDESVDSVENKDERSSHVVQSRTNLEGDEVFAFGSNKNLTLGLGDEDDRQYPERIHLHRSQFLLRRMHEDYTNEKHGEDGGSISSEIPAVIQNRTTSIQDVVMSKMHTAVLTNDSVSNLYVCGFGPGGRLGLGDEATRYSYTCVQGGGIAKKKVVAVALGQYHTIAICSTGEVFTWGSNKYGQLGYSLPETPSNDVPMQLLPRQLYGLIKKEQIIGAAGSSIHSVIYSNNAMFTFGKNEGQLGLVDADARSLETQVLPRRVGTSILQSPIKSVSAIDRASSVLLESHDVIVFTQYAWKKVVFPLEESPNALFSSAFSTTYSRQPNSICKITSGGSTICAISTYGQVFTVEVPRDTEQVAPSVSTTNPNKAKNALPLPSRVWTIGKPHMSAIDAAVGQDGSIILCTNSGSVWRKEKRAKIKSIHQKIHEKGNVKDYKFVRVANLTRAIAVRSNAFGAFMAVRKDAEVTRDQLHERPATLWNDISPLMAFQDYGQVPSDSVHSSSEPQYRFWVPRSKATQSASIRQAILTHTSAEDELSQMMNKIQSLSESPYDVWVTSNATQVQIPVHSFLVKARSRVLRSALAEMDQTYYFSITDVLAIEYGSDGYVRLNFANADFLTLVNLVLYLYTDEIIDVWHQTSRALHLAPRYRQVRIELMKIAASLELRHLEKAARIMVDPARSMRQDFELAYQDLDFWTHADVIIDLADGAETPGHSALLCVRCPFFEGLFNGRAGGMWMSTRLADRESSLEATRIDLKHIDEKIFLMVLRHIYADTDEDLFDDIITKDLDEFIDLIIDVMSVANELMLERLAQICQKVLGRYVTTRNVCGLLNTVAECSVDDFKNAALEYICLNLESMLDSRLLDELDDYLLEELNEVVQENQLSFMPFVRSGRSDAELLERHTQLIEDIERDQLRRIDYMRLPTRYVQDDDRVFSKRKPAQSEDDLPFIMDEDGEAAAMSPALQSDRASPYIRPESSTRRASHLSLGASYDVDEHLAATITPNGSPLLGTNTESSKTAWRNTALPGIKTDLKSILGQTTGPHVSNLTRQMTTASLAASPKTPSKMSQKERKRQQQEARKQENASMDTASSKPSTPQSPWTKVSPTPRRSVSSPLSEIKTSGALTAPAKPIRPGMTMRQTVSGTADAEKSTSFSSTDKKSIAWAAQSSSSQPSQIQSIRHTPMPERSGSWVDAHTSMADILAQQEGEKTAIKEAVAKRSLQEIQQEQEFQVWWDQESLRVQEEEARAIHVANRQSKSGRGGKRGGTNRASHPGRGNTGEQPPRSGRKISQLQAATTPLDGKGSHHAQPPSERNRGLSRKRGRGKAPDNQEVHSTND